MEADSWSFEGGEEAGLRTEGEAAELLRQSEARRRRAVGLLCAALLLVLSGALAVLISLGLGRRASPDGQMERQELNHTDPSVKDYPSAMLTAYNNENNTVGDYLRWEDKLGNAHCHGGFTYSNGSLVVPKKGMYRVFLQITYGNNKCHEHQIRLLNKVFSFGEEYKKDVPLLSSVHTFSCSENWSKTLYTSGVFYLQAGSKLRVTSSAPKYISRNEYDAFIGAELLLH